MKDIKINAKVIQDFNDKTKIVNGEPYKWEKNEIIDNMPRERFEELQSKGYVEEYKGKTKNEIPQPKNDSEWN